MSNNVAMESSKGSVANGGSLFVLIERVSTIQSREEESLEL
jgi:hypothetical protein